MTCRQWNSANIGIKIRMLSFKQCGEKANYNMFCSVKPQNFLSVTEKPETTNSSVLKTPDMEHLLTFTKHYQNT